MPNSIFVSYRRSDSQHASFAIVDRLRWAFGQDEVFFDRGSIESGADWSETIRSALHSAKVVLVVIGHGWLRVTDEWGRRRLDDPKDWVRREVCEALDREGQGLAKVIQVYLEGVGELQALALDASLDRLPTLELERLANDGWEEGLERLINIVAGIIGRARMLPGERHANGALARPEPRQKGRPVLSDEEVRVKLQQLSFWQLIWSPHPWGKDHRAQELCKVYELGSFERAVSFMAHAALAINRWHPEHHPRWENQWKVVSVAFTTWDVGCRITQLDFDAAQRLDQIYFEYLRLPTRQLKRTNL